MSLGRRELLVGTAAGLAVGACAREPPAAPAIRFVGPDPARGHLVRDAALAQRPVSEHERAGIVIVGAGVAGLSAAWRLERAGVRDYLLLEIEDELGGTARGGELPRSTYPMGAHYLPIPRPDFAALETLLDDLGLVIGRDRSGRAEYDPRAIVRAPVERHRRHALCHEGLYPSAGQSSAEADQFAAFINRLRELDRNGADGRRLFDLPVERSSVELRALDQISMADWLTREGFTSAPLRWLVDYGCRDDYGCRVEHTSAFAGLHHFLARGFEDAEDRLLLTWPAGNAHLCRAMAARCDLGDRLRVATAVIGIDPDAAVVTAYDLANDRTLRIAGDVVLWAAPRFVLRHALPMGRDPLATDALSYVPWLVANVEVGRAPAGTGAPLAWDNVPVDADHLGYVVANHLEDEQARRSPGAVLTFYEPWCAPDLAGVRARRAELLAADAETLATRVRTELDRMHGDLDVHAIDLVRWGHGMIRPVPGLLFGEGLARARAPIGRILPCSADTSGLALFEQAFANGVGAAETAMARRGRPAAATMLPT